MLSRIPPKYAVAEVMGSSKGQSAITVARRFGGRQRNVHLIPTGTCLRDKDELRAFGLRLWLLVSSPPVAPEVRLSIGSHYV